MAKQAVQAANDAAPAGHNSELTPAERKALFMDHYRPIAAQTEVVKEAKAELNRLRKLAKADKIPLKNIDFALRCAEINDEGIIPQELRDRAEIAAWFALPIDYQADMFGDFTREPGEERARREGRKAGALGRGGNPYDEDSVLGRAWAAEWRVEQEKARAALLSGMQKRNELIKAADDPAFPDETEEAA